MSMVPRTATASELAAVANHHSLGRGQEWPTTSRIGKSLALSNRFRRNSPGLPVGKILLSCARETSMQELGTQNNLLPYRPPQFELRYAFSGSWHWRC